MNRKTKIQFTVLCFRIEPERFANIGLIGTDKTERKIIASYCIFLLTTFDQKLRINKHFKDHSKLRKIIADG